MSCKSYHINIVAAEIKRNVLENDETASYKLGICERLRSKLVIGRHFLPHQPFLNKTKKERET
jgi:hypothetical protein